MQEREILETLLNESYVRAGRPGHVLCALSGGGDSVALALLLADLSDRISFQLTCAHVNHGLPGSADAEEHWVRLFASSHALPLLALSIAVPAGGNQENAAREARYTALRAMLDEAGADVIAVAHHAQDQAETLLMHLLRGSGGTGLAGMREMRGSIWRPLLGVSRGQIHAYLAARGEPWLEDATNADTARTRAFLRHRVIPLLEEEFPGASLRLAQAANAVAVDEDAWESMEVRWLARFARLDPQHCWLLRRPFLAQSLALRRRLARELCAACGVALDFALTSRLLELASGPANMEINLPGGAKAHAGEKALHILPIAVKSYHVSWEQPESLAPDGSLGDGLRVQSLNADAACGAVMRQWENGDVITPLGMRGTLPILKYLGGRHVDIPWREHWPVYARGQDVLWVPGLGISEHAAVRPDTKNVATLRFVGLLPWELAAGEGMDAED